MATDASNSDATADPWDVFGSEEDSSVVQASLEPSHPPLLNSFHDELAHVVTCALSAQPFNSPLTRRLIGILGNTTEATGAAGGSCEQLLTALRSRGLTAQLLHGDTDVIDGSNLWDALLVIQDRESNTLTWNENAIYCSLVAGGVLLVVSRKPCDYSGGMKAFGAPSCWDACRWRCEVLDHESLSVVTTTRKLPRAQSETCPWLNKSMQRSISEEPMRIESATVPLSASETWQARALSERSIQKAVSALLQYGYCILPRLLSARVCREMGSVALADMHEAAQVLLQNDRVDLYHPSDSTEEPAAYCELSLREDFRLDLRNGPSLDRVRTKAEHCVRNARDGAIEVDGNSAWTVRADTPLTETTAPFFRGNGDLLEIVRRCMNPTCDAVAKGNWGRFNFDTHSKPGTFQDLKVGRLGAIISLPGAAEQALHADTPHLFETDVHLPPHYINAFTPGRDSVDGVGQTALVHASHRLDAASRLVEGDDSWHGAVVRPRLDPGDVLLFDCRILHFGLANPSDSGVERPILYTNMTMGWFHDPKNWDEHQRIFTKPLDS